MASVASVSGIDKLSASNLRALNDAAVKIGIPVDWLATVISFETGATFSPSVMNKAGSGAFGLIQFLPKTAASLLGYPQTDEGKAQAAAKGKTMSFSEQLEKMVIPYFKWFPTPKSLNDTYFAVFYPAAMGKSSTTQLLTSPSLEYSQNQGFDREGKGWITPGDIAKTINSIYNAANTRINIPGTAIMSVIGGIFMAAVIWQTWKHKEEIQVLALKEYNKWANS